MGFVCLLQGSPYHNHHQYTSHSPLTLSPTAQRKQAASHALQQQQQQQQHGQQQQQPQQQMANAQHYHQLGPSGVSLSHSNLSGGASNQMLLGSSGTGPGGLLFHGHNVGHSQSNQQINFIVGGDGTGSSGGIGIIDNSNRPRSSCGRLPGIK